MRRMRASEGGGAGREGWREGVREGEILREVGLKVWALGCLS